MGKLFEKDANEKFEKILDESFDSAYDAGKQLLHPDDYAALRMSDMWIEDMMQSYEAKWLLENTAIGEEILDLGFGSGIVCKALATAGRNVNVVDGSAEFCKQANENGIPAHLAMFEEFVAPYQYDTVSASFVLEHVVSPVTLLMRAKQWANRLIVVVGNANSYHRQLAVKMGLQPELSSLSERDKLVGHYRVYDMETISRDLTKSGWCIKKTAGLMFKPYPNSMLAQQSPALIKAMNEIECPPECCANIILEARKF